MAVELQRSPLIGQWKTQEIGAPAVAPNDPASEPTSTIVRAEQLPPLSSTASSDVRRLDVQTIALSGGQKLAVPPLLQRSIGGLVPAIRLFRGGWPLSDLDAVGLRAQLASMSSGELKALRDLALLRPPHPRLKEAGKHPAVMGPPTAEALFAILGGAIFPAAPGILPKASELAPPKPDGTAIPAETATRFAMKTEARLMTEVDFERMKAAGQLHVVGVTGFSGQWSKEALKKDPELRRQHDAAEQQLSENLVALKERYGDKLVLSSGATDEGVPGMAYRIAAKLGIKALGVTSAMAAEFPLARMDHLIVHGENFGDESPIFLRTSDELLMIGGGGQAHREALESLFASHKDVSVLGDVRVNADRDKASAAVDSVFEGWLKRGVRNTNQVEIGAESFAIASRLDDAAAKKLAGQAVDLAIAGTPPETIARAMTRAIGHQTKDLPPSMIIRSAAELARNAIAAVRLAGLEKPAPRWRQLVTDLTSRL